MVLVTDNLSGNTTYQLSIYYIFKNPMILLTEISSSGIIISCFLACVCAVCQAGHLSEGARWRRREEEEISCCSSRGQRRPDTGQGRRRLRGRFVLTETRPLHPRVCVWTSRSVFPPFVQWSHSWGIRFLFVSPVGVSRFLCVYSSDTQKTLHTRAVDVSLAYLTFLCHKLHQIQ